MTFKVLYMCDTVWVDCGRLQYSGSKDNGGIMIEDCMENPSVNGWQELFFSNKSF